MSIIIENNDNKKSNNKTTIKLAAILIEKIKSVNFKSQPLKNANINEQKNKYINKPLGTTTNLSPYRATILTVSLR